MTEPPEKPVLQKPPGYRDLSNPGQPVPLPPGRKPAIPPSFRPKKKSRSCWGACCFFFCILVLFLIVFFLVAGGLFYFWFDPKLPEFHLQSFKLPQLNVTVKPDGTYLNVEAVARVEVKNPNSKLEWYYDGTRFEISIGNDTVLGSKNLPKFSVGKKNTTSLKVVTSVKNQLVPDGIGTKLKSQISSKDLMVFVNVKTKAGLVAKGWNAGTMEVNVLCGNVKLKNLENGEMPKCTINLLEWINIH
ncbi:putative Late embryogenesis abundant hydroxyproline-rich glycoprotein family [Quillaja saponaria]|uniref:Late embryogenesis abundant hydroxyproline-rich glycoprotein family n=1 Tax=Quillaja saponaria TaxID=32244 RepID=A0AAD7PPP1_QUISA|nr:putative Late embryogenesis abundant hydroxyproline-rich glycoprotein family [Quillaja saponaria]